MEIKEEFMSKKSQPTPTRQLPWLWLVSGAAVLLIAAGLVLWRSSASPSPQTGGSDAHLVVDKTTIDEGKVKLGTPIRTTFRLSNTGSQPLQILGEPQVELIEGC